MYSSHPHARREAGLQVFLRHRPASKPAPLVLVPPPFHSVPVVCTGSRAQGRRGLLFSPKQTRFALWHRQLQQAGRGARSFDLQFPVSRARHSLSAGPAPGPAPRRCTQGTGLAARRSLPAGRGWMSLFHGPLL